MAEKYVTLSEAAELEGIQYKAMQRKVVRDIGGFSAIRVQRENGGKDMTMIPISSLSASARKAWRERERLKELAAHPQEEAADSRDDVPWYVEVDAAWFREAHKKKYYQAVELGNVVREFLAMKNLPGRSDMAEEFAQERIGKKARTLYRYEKAYLEASAWADRKHREDGGNYDVFKILCLCRKPKEAGNFPSFKPEVKQAVKNIWFNKEFAANQGTREMLYDKLLELQRINHWDKIPSYQSVVRYINYLMEDEGMKNAWYLASHGVREYKNKVMGKALLDTTVLKPMEVVMGDEHTFDCWVAYTQPNGKITPVRPVLCAWIDVRSRRILGDVICRHANADILKQSMIKLVLTPGCGVPEFLLVDNGKDYTAEFMMGLPRNVRNDNGYVDITSGFYRRIGIEDVHRALPYHPWTKGQMERFFGGVCSRFTKWMSSYTGTLTGSRTDAKIPKDIQKMCDRGELLTMEEFYGKWQEWLTEKYEKRSHRGLKEAGEKYTRPLELFENEERYFKPAPPKSYLQTLMYREERVHVYNFGIKRFGLVYDNENLKIHIGENLSILVDRNDLTSIFVQDKDGRTICEAECQELLAFGSHVSEERLKAHIRNQNRQLQKDRQLLEDANVPFEELYHQEAGFGSMAGGIDLMIGKKPEQKDNVVSLPLDKQYRDGFRAEHKDRGKDTAGSEYINSRAEEALKELRAL